MRDPQTIHVFGHRCRGWRREDAQLVRQLGQLLDLQQTPVVFLTGHLQPERSQELRQLGVRQVLSKPFDPLQLAAQLQQIWEAEHG